VTPFRGQFHVFEDCTRRKERDATRKRDQYGERLFSRQSRSERKRFVNTENNTRIICTKYATRLALGERNIPKEAGFHFYRIHNVTAHRSQIHIVRVRR